MARLKDLRLRWLLWARGECAHDGCRRPSMRHLFTRCSEHEAHHWREVGRRIEAEKFEREVQVHAEALRRVMAATPQGEETPDATG